MLYAQWGKPKKKSGDNIKTVMLFIVASYVRMKFYYNTYLI
jgi:hypothetical protein